MNVITIMGRLTHNPELRKTQSGKSVTSFTLAVNRPYRSEGNQAADFINCVAWNQTAEFVSSYFAKGQQVAVTGRLQIRDYTTRDGDKRTVAEVIVDRAYFADSKRTEESAAPAPAAPSNFTELDEDDGDLPF